MKKIILIISLAVLVMKKKIYIQSGFILLMLILSSLSQIKAQDITYIHATQNDKWLILTDGNDSLISEPLLIKKGSVAVTNNGAKKVGGEPIIKDFEDSVWAEINKSKYKMSLEIKAIRDEKIKEINKKKIKMLLFLQ